VLIGSLLVGLSALLGAWVFAATSERISVMVAARDIEPGEVIDAGDLRVVEMGATGELRAIQPSQQNLIVGRAARGPIPAGTVLNTGLFAAQGETIPAGMVVVGASLEAGAAPTADLRAGQRVDVLGVEPTTGAPAGDGSAQPAAQVIASGTVWSVERASSNSSSSKLWVSILVPAATQGAVAQAAADGLVRLSLVGAG
jgi:Flp pilus assembly protein CpaB